MCQQFESWVWWSSWQCEAMRHYVLGESESKKAQTDNRCGKYYIEGPLSFSVNKVTMSNIPQLPKIVSPSGTKCLKT